MLNRRFARASIVLLSICGAFAAAAQDDLVIHCRRWDDAFISATYLGATLFALAAAVATFFSGRFAFLFPGRWLRVRPGYRALCIFIFAALTGWVVVVASPKFYLGGYLWSGVDPVYRQCVAQSFGGAGLFGGRVGAGTAAYAQNLALSLLVIGAAGIAVFVAWLLGRVMASRNMRVS